MDKTIIGLLGFIGSGKTTVGNIMSEEYGFQPLSFAASLKDMLSVVFGWDRKLLEGETPESRIWRDIPDRWWSEKLDVKEFTPRFALQNIGTDLFRNKFHQDIWLLSLERKINDSSHHKFVITDIRFKNEIEFVRSIGGKLWEVSRGEKPEWYSFVVNANKGAINSQQYINREYPGLHSSETEWVGTKVDYVVDNSSGIEELRKSVWGGF